MSFRTSSRIGWAVAVAMAIASARAAVPAAPAAAAQTKAVKFKLKPGAEGKLCVTCHVDFEDKLKLPAVHTPVKAGECTGCHSPHAADHEKMLAEKPTEICASCHEAIVPKNAKSVHKALEGGGCIACHDPHASANKNNLLQPAGTLCVSCHKDLGEQLVKNKFAHSPVKAGCVTCHDPHASTSSERLLVKAVPALCLACHKPDQPAFSKAHLGYPVAKGNCVSCHDPHGSDTQALLWNNVHKPMVSKMCAQCHNDAGSATALQTKKNGVDLCRSCHSDVVNEAFAAKHIHAPVLDRVGCLNCHNPHATKASKLIKAPMKTVCGACHSDTIERQNKSVTKHPPIDAGDCATCHKPHAGDNAFLLTGATQFDVCGTCHDWEKHSGHPIGAKVVDPRNKNLTLDCESCHRTHGTEFKHFTHKDAKTDLCVQCHATFRR